MRCTSRKRIGIGLLCSFLLLVLCGCGDMEYTFPYSVEYGVSSFQVVQTDLSSHADPFAQELCIVVDNTPEEVLTVDVSGASAALLCDLNNTEVIFAKNVHEQLNPASLTKVMTALVALKYGTLDQQLTATDTVIITEAGAQLLGVKPGDTMTLAQALHIMLLYSANDVAMLVAEGVGGSVEAFLELMNEEAQALGATNSHFMNPHGLTEDKHYTTAYDMYLIFNEAIKYETFREIIHMSSYSTVYYDKGGNEKTVSIRSTNRYFRDDFTPPDGVTVVGGKTGTTNAAGHCLILLARDTAGAPYISVILRAGSSDNLYMGMTNLLSEIGSSSQ